MYALTFFPGVTHQKRPTEIPPGNGAGLLLSASGDPTPFLLLGAEAREQGHAPKLSAPAGNGRPGWRVAVTNRYLSGPLSSLPENEGAEMFKK